MYKQLTGLILVAVLAVPMIALAAGDTPVKTIEQLYAEKDQLANTHIHIAGKVVKVNNDIMGKNFLHIQDGTGAEGTNDVTVTSQQTANIGDEIEVDALVITNRDFGMGYSYPVILEEATLSGKAH